MSLQKEMKLNKKLIIYTHPYVDVDNVVATCAKLVTLGVNPKDADIRFVSANTENVPEDAIPIDIAADKHPDGLSYTSSYFSGILPDRIINEVVEQDSTGRSSSRISLAFIISALRQVGLDDREIIAYLFKIIRGWIELMKIREKERENSKKAEFVKIGRYFFMIKDSGNKFHGIGQKISRKSIKKPINGFLYIDRNNMGVYRYPMCKTPDFSCLKLPGWFSHPSGFLFCWGSKKAPAEKPPSISVLKFIEFLNRELN